MIGSFGDIIFEVSDQKILTFEDLKIDSAPRFGVHTLLMEKPKLEFTGNKLDEVTMTIHLNANHGVSPADEIDKFRNKSREGTAENLVIGGNVIGDGAWVITRLSQAWGTVWNDGKLFSAYLDLTLTEYIELRRSSNVSGTIVGAS